MVISIDSKEVQANLQRVISDVLPDGIQQALEQASLVVEGEAKGKCPVDSGQLRASITHQVGDSEATIFTNVEYAPYVELGTGIHSSLGNGRQTPWTYQGADGEWHTTTGQAPQPFMKPAVESSTAQVLQCFKGIL